FQLDLELGASVLLERRVAADVTFCLQHVENALADLGAGCRHLRLLAHLRIPDAGEHIAQRIGHCHIVKISYQLDLTRPGISPAEPRSRSAMRDILSLR